MLVSDLVGFIASIFLLIPALKDQFYRFKTDQQERMSTDTPWPGLRKAVASAWKVKRESYDATDSLVMLLGAMGLVVAFFLKLTSA